MAIRPPRPSPKSDAYIVYLSWILGVSSGAVSAIIVVMLRRVFCFAVQIPFVGELIETLLRPKRRDRLRLRFSHTRQLRRAGHHKRDITVPAGLEGVRPHCPATMFRMTKEAFLVFAYSALRAQRVWDCE